MIEETRREWAERLAATMPPLSAEEVAIIAGILRGIDLRWVERVPCDGACNTLGVVVACTSCWRTT